MPFKNDGKCFLFHLESSFCSQDIKVFVMTFWSCRKNGLIRKIRLTSKFMMSQPSLQTIAVYIIPNVSQSKYSQAMKFVWPINRVQQEKYISSKIIRKMRQGD